MNTRNNSNPIHLIHRLFAAILLIALSVPVAVAGEAEAHNPYTIYGMRLRSHLIPETPGATEDLGPLVFQEIVPCRFVSTVEQDKYDNPWGGKEYQMLETRTYYPKGELISSNGWVNPCTRHVPLDAVAVSLRLTSIKPETGTNVYLAPATLFARSQQGIWFAGGRNEMKEANVVLVNNGFSMSTDQVAHLTIDIIGFFLRDPMGVGAQGEKGDKGNNGERGEAGAQGLQGARGETGSQGTQGEKGDRGESGAQGTQGARGETGSQGTQGEKGDRGESGAQGTQGEKGDRGEAGAQGTQGEKGDRGESGAKGTQGEKGDRGESGAQGTQGEKGDRGESGAQGLKGDNGQPGAQGSKGDQGDRGLQGDRGANGANGANGATGATGAQGPMGPQGPQGAKGDSGNPGFTASAGGPYTFPPGGSITIHDPAVTQNSFIVLIYVEVSHGNALGVDSQSRGSFVASGSPNKPFKYLVVTMQ